MPIQELHMKPFRLVMLSMIVASLAGTLHAAPTSMLTNVRAADVLANLLTVAVDRTDANVAAIQKYLAEIGKADAYTKDRPTPPEDNRLSYNEVFKGALVFVQEGGGAKFADPSLQNRSQDDLLERLNQLQGYNIQQFMKLAKKREGLESLRMYLRQNGEFEKYHAWALKNAPDVATTFDEPAPATQPAGQTPSAEQIAARMKVLIAYARQIEWRKAQALGVSAADFDQQWNDWVEKHKDQVAARVEGVRALGGSLSKSELSSSSPPAPAAPQPAPYLGPLPASGNWTAAPPQQSPQYTLPPPVESIHTPDYYKRKNDEIYWNAWDGRWYNRGRPYP
jgi:hypothetical protein